MTKLTFEHKTCSRRIFMQVNS